MFKKKYRKKLTRKYKTKYMKIKSKVGVLVTDLNYYILLENSGVSQCNEAQKNYAVVKLQVPKRVTLSNGRTFAACYKRI